ncbi:MAG: hypothetical protein RDU13_05295 [Elusimicrobiales bacterium]|nr:hypothetical protein [Elusimicrobiales bacterium]
MRNILLAFMMLSAPAAWAASAREGMGAAMGAAELRDASFRLVEIEAFADEAGDISCAKRSFANTWKYKFYSRGAGWAVVSACGGTVLNYAGHRPYDTGREPVMELPGSFADSPAAAEKVHGSGAASKKRDSLMNFAYHKGDGDRPDGFYWKVTRGRKSVFVSADGDKKWGESPVASATAGASGPKGKFLKARDPAAKYYQVAVTEVRKKYPGAQLRMVEAITDRTGSAKCLDEQDGWWFIFYAPQMKTYASLSGCNNKTMHRGVDYEGRNALAGMLELPADFRDSDAAAAALPGGACSGLSSSTMRLKNYRRGKSPVGGGDFVWTVTCGSTEHFVDARTGRYLGAAEK